MKWKLPADLTRITMRIKIDDDDNPIQLPLACPMTIRFTIT